MKVPLLPDPYFQYTLGNPGTPPLVGSMGFLDGNGQASIARAVPGGIYDSLAGLTLFHAYIVGDQVSRTVVSASNPQSLTLDP